MKTPATLILLLFVCLSAAMGEPAPHSSHIGGRPQDSVFDPGEVLSAEQRKEIAEPLAKVRKDEEIDVMVVILPEIGDAPPHHVAAGFAEKWASTQVNAVVLHVPGMEGSPWIFPGRVIGTLLQPESLKNTMLAAEKRAGAETTDFGKVRAASIEASDALRYWMGGAKIQTEKIISERREVFQDYEDRRRLMKLAAFVGAALTIPLVLGVIFGVMRYQNSRPISFPSVRIIRRLGAPHAGGGQSISTRPRS